MGNVLFPKAVVADVLRNEGYRRAYMGEAPYELLANAAQGDRAAGGDSPAPTPDHVRTPPPGTREPTAAEREELARRARKARRPGEGGPAREIRK